MPILLIHVIHSLVCLYSSYRSLLVGRKSTDSFDKGLWISVNSRSITLVQINERSPGHIGGLDWELTYFMS